MQWNINGSSSEEKQPNLIFEYVYSSVNFSKNKEIEQQLVCPLVYEIVPCFCPI